MQAQNSNPIPKQKVIFKSPASDNFYHELKKRVESYFRNNNLSKSANAAMVFKTGIILIAWIGTYFLVITNILNPVYAFVIALMHGFITALVGVNIGHDAIHGSYTNNPKTNKFLGLTFNFIGANDYVWSISHNVVHHTYTNIPEHDGDITSLPILRMEPTQKLQKIHRFQHIYAYFFYTLATLSWVFIKDYKKFF